MHTDRNLHLVFHLRMRNQAVAQLFEALILQAGSISDDVIGFFNLPNSSSCTMALGVDKPLTEMSTRYLPGAKGGRRVRLTT
jgi:hypothetical protein